jgi:phenylpyruvate tautomerase PptA (4-oxalocrotonate tautomerase family)
MPYLKIQTNVKVENRNQLLTDATAFLSELLGKPAQYIMVVVEHKLEMLFSGTDEPLAFLELKSIGLPENETSILSARICDFIQETLSIPKDRIYIEFSNAERHMFGWNGKTFEK